MQQALVETRGEIRRLLLARKMYRPKIIFSLLTSSKEKEDCHFTKNKVVTFIYNDKFTMYSDSCDIILSSLTTSRRQYQNKPQPSVTSPISSPKTISIHSFWSQNTEKRNTAISQMRLRSVFKMRMSILNAATTEHLGYGSISFFVYTKSTDPYFSGGISEFL